MRNSALGLVIAICLAAAPARAEWEVNEIYSNADGTVQFIEFAAPSGGLPPLERRVFRSFSVSRPNYALSDYTFATSLPGDSAGRKFLLATAGFAALGIVAPDYVMPDRFLELAGGGLLDWAHSGPIMAYPALPTDGRSLDRNGVPGPASPTNFEGITGALPPPGASLGVSHEGSGSGSIVSAPSGIACGATCTAGFAQGASVTLDAVPDPGSTFAGWSGDCAGTGPCTVSISADRYVTARFTAAVPAEPVSRFANLSSRLRLGSGNDVMIGGFVLGGTTPRTVAIRARGPSLAAAGVPGVLPDPTIFLYAGQFIRDMNDDYGAHVRAPSVVAAGLAPSDATESVVFRDLAPGAYTAVVTGGGLPYLGSVDGVGIVEIFDTDPANGRLVNLSTRGRVRTGDDVMIAGFVIAGPDPRTVLLRARGPSLLPYGVPDVLLDPVLQLFEGATLLASNDDWPSSPDAAAIQSSGFAPSDARESVIRITLNPGAYTAIVSGKNGTTGVGIVEVFAQ